MEEDIETCGWFVFYKDQLLIEKKNGMYTIPFGTEPPMPVPVGSTIHTIGEIEGRTAKTFSVHAPVPGSENDRHLMMDLRSSYDVLPWEEYNVGGKAFQILNWDKNSRLPYRFLLLLKNAPNVVRKFIRASLLPSLY